jgi:cysteinyl-tRNA synthetase
MHSGHINVNNVKMSKSLNNFILAKDLIAKYGSNAIR